MMTDENQKEEKTVIEVTGDLANIIKELAKRSGRTVDQVVAELLSASIKKMDKLLEDEDEEETTMKVLDKEADRSEFIREMKEILLLKNLQGDTDEKTLMKLLNRNMLMSMIMYQQQQLQRMFEKMLKSEEREDSKTLELLSKLTERIENLAKTQPETAKELAKTLAKYLRRLEKAKSEEKKSKLEERIEELRKIIEAKEKEAEKKELDEKFKKVSEEITKLTEALNSRIEYLESLVARGQQSNDIIEQLQRLRQLRETVKELSEVLGVAQKQPIVTREGKVDWGSILQNVLDTVRELGKVALQRPPQPTSIQTLPQVPQIENFPKPEPQKIETPKVETPKQEIPKVEIPKQETSQETPSIDENQIIEGTHFTRVKDLYEMFGKENVKVEGGTVKVKRGENWITLSKEQIKEIDDNVFMKRLKAGEIAFKTDYKSVEELFNDEDTLKTAYMMATEGMRVQLADGTDVTDKVLEIGKQRGYESFEEYIKKYGGVQTQG